MAKRRRGSRTAPPSARATARSRSSSSGRSTPIPMPFAAALDEVAIVIADEPTRRPAARERARARRHAVRPVRGRAPDRVGRGLGAVPNRITLFRLPLEEDFADPDDLADEVWVTVVHELAHHLGIDDDRLARARRRLSGARPAQPAPRARDTSQRRSPRRAKAANSGRVSQRNGRRPGRGSGWIVVATGSDVVEPEGGPRQADEHDDLRRHRDRAGP